MCSQLLLAEQGHWCQPPGWDQRVDSKLMLSDLSASVLPAFCRHPPAGGTMGLHGPFYSVVLEERYSQVNLFYL